MHHGRRVDCVIQTLTRPSKHYPLSPRCTKVLFGDDVWVNECRGLGVGTRQVGFLEFLYPNPQVTLFIRNRLKREGSESCASCNHLRFEHSPEPESDSMQEAEVWTLVEALERGHRPSSVTTPALPGECHRTAPMAPPHC